MTRPRWARAHRDPVVFMAWQDLCEAICCLSPVGPPERLPETAARLHRAVLAYAAAFQHWEAAHGEPTGAGESDAG